MIKKYRLSLIVSLAVVASYGVAVPAHASEIDELKATVQAMQESMEQMQARIAKLKREKADQ